MKKYSDVLIINILALGIGVTLFYVSDKVEILGAVIATGISLSIGVRQYRTENDKLFKELFKEFNTKYDIKFNEALKSIIESAESDEAYKLNKTEEELIVDYLNFCAEEYLWNTKDRIPEKVWSSWENGMLYYLNKPIINQVVVREKGQKDSYYGLFEKIKDRTNNLH